ncbi:MAG: hypothetical protein AB1428_01460 [Bacteroidota bacterium]
MTTKPPAQVHKADASAVEALAYASAEGIPVVEPHDRDRLGFNIWRVLALKNDTLEHAITSAGARMLIGEEEAVAKVRAFLQSKGMTL